VKAAVERRQACRLSPDPRFGGRGGSTARCEGYGLASVGVLPPSFYLGAAPDRDGSGFHCRIDLTKAGIAANIFGTACTTSSDANKKRAARAGSLFRHREAGEGDRPAQQDGGGGAGLTASVSLKFCSNAALCEIPKSLVCNKSASTLAHRRRPRPLHRASRGAPPPLRGGGKIGQLSLAPGSGTNNCSTAIGSGMKCCSTM
jgi:hypothetical protein